MPQMQNPFFTGSDFKEAAQNPTDPQQWLKFSPMMVMDRFTPHGMMGLGPSGKMGKKGGGAYATGQFDVPSYQARQDIMNFMRSSEDQQQKDYADSIQRGIENRKVAKEQENKAIFGPKLDATKLDKMPGFLADKGPTVASGADRGTLYGKALEDAMKEGKMTTGKLDESIGAKGSPTGLRNESIPAYQSRFTFDPLTPADVLHAGAANMAQGMNQKKGGK